MTSLTLFRKVIRKADLRIHRDTGIHLLDPVLEFRDGAALTEDDLILLGILGLAFIDGRERNLYQIP